MDLDVAARMGQKWVDSKECRKQELVMEVDS